MKNLKNTNILVFNNGSSSIKCSLYDFSLFTGSLLQPIWHEHIEWKNINRNALTQLTPLLHGKKVDIIGHRVVHGGRYTQTKPIDETVKQEIARAAELAPLHNLADLEAIQAAEKIFPHARQFAVFDTAFHSTMLPAAYTYAIAEKWRNQGIRRFGFHGISFSYCSKRAEELVGKRIDKMIICHLGSGASLCAVKQGKSIDTTMGFTPLEGLVMDTRSGSIDPGILLYLLQQKHITVEQLSAELYERSGLLGLSGISSDMRDILNCKDQQAPAKLALDVYLHRLIGAIGAMAAALGGLDTLVFTAGIGEHAAYIIEQSCQQLAFLGIELTDSIIIKDKDAHLSAQHSPITVLQIHTEEAFEIARQCYTFS